MQYDQGLGVFTTVATGLTEKQFTMTGLTIGITYAFRVNAHNSFGTSLTWSDELEALCAGPPLAPTAPVTTASYTSIQIQWFKPDNQGAVITAYRIYIRASD